MVVAAGPVVVAAAATAAAAAAAAAAVVVVAVVVVAVVVAVVVVALWAWPRRARVEVGPPEGPDWGSSAGGDASSRCLFKKCKQNNKPPHNPNPSQPFQTRSGPVENTISVSFGHIVEGMVPLALQFTLCPSFCPWLGNHPLKPAGTHPNPFKPYQTRSGAVENTISVYFGPI